MLCKKVFSIVGLLCSLGCGAYPLSHQLSFRGIWVPANDFATKTSADALLEKVTRANLNAIFPAVMCHGKVYYKTSHYRYTIAVSNEFDPLDYLIKTAHKRNISVHPWFCVYYEGATDTLIPKNPEWLTPGFDGISTGSQYFLDPALPEVKSYLKTVMLDILPYDIDGFHLDYIRYCGNLYGYGAQSRAMFKSEYGFDPLDLILYPEKIDPVRFNQYPVYCIVDREFNKSHYWIPNRIEPYLAFAKIRPKFIQAGQLPEIPIPSAVLVTGLYPIDNITITNIVSYINRGGNLVYIDTGKPEFIGDMSGTLKRVWETQIVKLAEKVTIQSFEQGAIQGPVINKKLVELAKRNGRKFDHTALANRKELWDSWRANQVQDLVNQLYREVKKQKPNVIISAAVGDLETDKTVVLRDSGGWLKQGIIDILCPMDYTESVSELKSIIAKSKQDAGEKWHQVYPGLALYTRIGKMTKPRNPKTVAEQIQAVKSAGYQGIMFFSSNQLDESLVQILNAHLK
ncbi:MAG: family 10 glycosylhydrolase [bacterium]|nr:family 10 glycosylhydrolase [bacterium]